MCPATVAQAEIWKLGQLRPNNTVRFRRLTPEEAAAAELAQLELLQRLGAPVDETAPVAAVASTVAPLAPVAPIAPGIARGSPSPHGADAPVVAARPASGAAPDVVYRRAGDKYLLIEYGPPVLDLELRLRVHALMSWLEKSRVSGIIELTPGIRSLQVHYESRMLPLSRLLRVLGEAEEAIAGIDDVTIATRVVHLPLSWDDQATQLAITKYMQSVRADAPWCPSNIEFIRRVNGLESIAEVKRIVFGASYLVLGLGDVYLGAPVTTPIDPRHRLVTTKYNPARTWTPENAVGIGGAYLCVYGMEGPGGYQLVGRTCQMWNTYRVTREFTQGQPWLLRFFDQIRFYPVSGEELLEFRDDFLHGRVHLDIRDEVFRLEDYRHFLDLNSADIEAHKSRQQAAFEAERRRWEASGQIGYAAELPAAHSSTAAQDLEPGDVPVASPVSGSVWQIAAVLGQRVMAGDTLVTVESMKMELPVTAPVDGVVSQVRCVEGRAVTVAQTLMVLSP